MKKTSYNATRKLILNLTAVNIIHNGTTTRAGKVSCIQIQFNIRLFFRLQKRLLKYRCWFLRAKSKLFNNSFVRLTSRQWQLFPMKLILFSFSSRFQDSSIHFLNPIKRSNCFLQLPFGTIAVFPTFLLFFLVDCFDFYSIIFLLKISHFDKKKCR